MATCASRKIDSNFSGLAIAEEECLMELPEGDPAEAAFGSITMTGTGADGEEISIGATTLTFVDAAPGAGEVLVGGTAAATATNLAAAIASVPGVVLDGAVQGAKINIKAATPGAAGNSIAFATDSADVTFSDTTLQGGMDATSGAIWYGREPNSYSDFGGEIATTARQPIDPSRQNKKGTPTDLDASGGWNEDLTQNNFKRPLQGFFFADARENAATDPLNGAKYTIDAVVGGNKYQFDGNTPDAPAFAPGQIVAAEGFTLAANNAVSVVTAIDATGLTVAAALTNQAVVPIDTKVTQVGQMLAVGDCSLVMQGGIATLQLTAGTWGAQYYPGRWIYVGGDSANSRFNNNRGFARIGSVEPKILTLDDTAWQPTAEVGAGKGIHLYFGTVVRNEKNPELIKRRSYQLERSLGRGPDGPQAEYLEGAVPNEFTLNIPQADKLAADVTYVACDHTMRTGAPGDEMKAGLRVNALNEDAFNTSSNVVRIKMHIHDDMTSNPDALFGYVTEANVAINNGVTPNKAVGVFGAFDTSAGNFSVTGSTTVYFQTVEAIRAVRNNADVGLSFICAARNAGFLFDLPLLSLGGGRANVEKDQPITLPLTTNAAENKWGYTMQYQVFEYLPNIAMP